MTQFFEFLKTFLTNNAVGLGALFVTPLLAWFFNRKKETSDLKKSDADASSVIANSSGQLALGWETFAKKMQDEYNECKDLTEKLDDRVTEVTKNNVDLMFQQGIMKKQNDRLKTFAENLSTFLENFLVEIEKINPDLAKSKKEELDKIKVQFQGE